MSNNILFHGKTKSLSGEFRKNIRNTLVYIANENGYEIQELNYILMSDDELLEINQTHLNHDDYTDIITFNLSDIEAMVDGEIYISLDRIKDNATRFKCSVETELVRVLCHGLLHLIGYNDKSETESLLMRKKEDECISVFQKIAVPRENAKNK